jgi:hypothetical protein
VKWFIELIGRCLDWNDEQNDKSVVVVASAVGGLRRRVDKLELDCERLWKENARLTAVLPVRRRSLMSTALTVDNRDQVSE